MKIYKVSYFIIWLVILLVPFYAFADFGYDNSQYTNLKYLLRILLFVYLVINFNLFKIYVKRTSSYKYYLIYLFIASISILFSGDKIYSLIKLSEVLLLLATSIVIVKKYVNKLEDIPKVVAILLGFYIIGFLIIANTFYPSLYRYMGQDGTARLGGGLVNPNLLGYCLMIFLISLEFLKKKYPYFLIILMKLILVYGIYLTHSRSVWIFFILYLFFKFVYRNKLFLTFFISGIIISFSLLKNLVFEYLSRGEGIERILSLSGRLPIWKELISIYEFDIYFIFGRGFQMLSGNGLGIKLNSFGSSSLTELTMAHNNFIQVLYGMGIIGLFFSIIVMVKLHQKIALIKNNKLREFFSYTFWSIFTFSFVEFGVYGSPNILVLIFSIFIFSTFKYVRPKVS